MSRFAALIFFVATSQILFSFAWRRFEENYAAFSLNTFPFYPPL